MSQKVVVAMLLAFGSITMAAKVWLLLLLRR